MQNFNGRSALVTGAGRGIGQACAMALAQAGARVVVSDHNMGLLQETLGLLREADGSVTGIAADLGDAGQIETMVSGAFQHLGKLDIAINCGAVYDRSPAEDWDMEDFDRVLRINLQGVYACLRAQCDRMADQGGGAIVNVASIAGLKGGRGIAYTASKHAIVGLTKSIALLYARRNVRINALCPGPTDTQLLRQAGEINRGSDLSNAEVPMGRKARPDEIAAAALWLCSDAASYATGMAMPVDGGIMAG